MRLFDELLPHSAGDVLLLAGKGHETGQIIGNQVRPFSDHDVAKAAAGELVNG